jgi:hypothetical protein
MRWVLFEVEVNTTKRDTELGWIRVCTPACINGSGQHNNLTPNEGLHVTRSGNGDMIAWCLWCWRWRFSY